MATENSRRTPVRAMAANDFWINAGPKAQEPDRPGGEAYGSGDTSTAPRKAPAFRVFLSGNPTSSVGRLASDHYMRSHQPAMTERAVLDMFELALREGDLKTIRQAISAGRKMAREAHQERSKPDDWVMVARNEGEARGMRGIIDALTEQFPADLDPKIEKRSFPLEVDGRKTEIAFEEPVRNQRPLPRSMDEIDLDSLRARLGAQRDGLEPKTVAVVLEKGMDDAAVSRILQALPEGQGAALTMTDAELKRFAAAHKTLAPGDKRPLSRIAATEKELNAQTGVVVVHDGQQSSRSAARLVKMAQRGSLVRAFDRDGNAIDSVGLAADLEPFHLTKAQEVRQGSVPAFNVPLATPEAAAALDMIRRNRTSGVTQTTLSDAAKTAILAIEGRDEMTLNEALSRAAREDGGLGLSNIDREILSNEETLHQARLSFASMQQQLQDHDVALIGREQMPPGLSAEGGPRYLYAMGDIEFGARAGRVVGMMADEAESPAAAAARDAAMDEMRKTFAEEGLVLAEVEGLGDAPLDTEARRILILPRGHAAGTEAEIQRAEAIADAGGVVYSTMPPESTLVGYAQREDGRQEKHWAEVGVTSRRLSPEEARENFGKDRKAAPETAAEKAARDVTATLRRDAELIGQERALALGDRGKEFEDTLLKRAEASGISPLEAYERVNARRAGLELDAYRTARTDRDIALSHVDAQQRAAYRASVESRAEKAGLSLDQAWEKVAAQKAGVSVEEYAEVRARTVADHERQKAEAYEKRAAAVGMTVEELKQRVEMTRKVEHIPAPAPAPKSARDIARLDGIVSAHEKGDREPTAEEARFASAMRIAKSGDDREMVKTAFAQIAHHGMRDAVADVSKGLASGSMPKDAMARLLRESGESVRDEGDLPRTKGETEASLSRISERNEFLAKRANRKATLNADYGKAKAFAGEFLKGSKQSAYEVFRALEAEDRAAADRANMEQAVGKSGKSVQKRTPSAATPASVNSAARNLARISDQMVIGSMRGDHKAIPVSAAITTMVEKGTRPVMLRPLDNGPSFQGNRRLLEERGLRPLEKLGATADDLARVDAKSIGDSRLVVDAGAQPGKAAKQIAALTRGEQVKNHARQRSESLRDYM